MKNFADKITYLAELKPLVGKVPSLKEHTSVERRVHQLLDSIEADLKGKPIATVEVKLSDIGVVQGLIEKFDAAMRDVFDMADDELRVFINKKMNEVFGSDLGAFVGDGFMTRKSAGQNGSGPRDPAHSVTLKDPKVLFVSENGITYRLFIDGHELCLNRGVTIKAGGGAGCAEAPGMYEVEVSATMIALDGGRTIERVPSGVEIELNFPVATAEVGNGEANPA